MTVFISRRELLKRAAVASAVAAVVPPSALTPTAPPALAPAHLTAVEAEILDAVVGRLIPTDANGPGAAEARAAQYIDRALGGALASSRDAYAAGLSALDRYARSAKGKRFVELGPADQDAVLTEVESGTATGFLGGSAAFFQLVRSHTIQGTFCDPYYGGNANFVGWDLVGYPGVRTIVTADDQRLGRSVPPNHKSAYDFETFTKASARARGDGGPHHGD